MKPSSLLVVAVTTALITLCTSFSSGKGASHSGPSPVSKEFQNQHYYWYLADGGTYDGFWTVAQEITRMEDDYGVFCDTDPTGGTTVSRGYVLPIPTLIWPSQFVFAHF